MNALDRGFYDYCAARSVPPVIIKVAQFYLEKDAKMWDDIISYMNKNPRLTGALTGAGIGGLGGLMTGAGGQGALIGALTGGAAGYGLGHYWPDIRKKLGLRSPGMVTGAGGIADTARQRYQEKYQGRIGASGLGGLVEAARNKYNTGAVKKKV